LVVGGGDVVVVVAREADDDDGVGGSGGTGAESLVDGFGALVGVVASSLQSGGFQRGHFFASAESSGTSTISLSLRSKTLIR
jgi:hypothetical protein